MVSHSTPAAAQATATHWMRRRRSFNTSTPSKTLSSGLMKYPRLASITCPALIAQMYRPQLNAIATLLPASMRSARGCAAMLRHQRRPELASSQATTSTVLHTMRWAMICSDGTALSRCQYTGTSPHNTKVEAVINNPRRASCDDTALIAAPWRR